MAWHARLSASTAARWMNCTGSVALIESLGEGGDGGQSEYAALGTAAHHLGAHCLREGVESAYDLLGQRIDIIDGDAYWHKSRGKPDGLIEYSFTVDGDMAEAVDVYLETVAAVRAELPGDDEQVEVTMDMSWLHERFGGTADFLKAEPFGLLAIVDYKHGSGVVVEVKDNYQLRKYAVGALHLRPDCDRVRVYIVQPRAPHPDGPVRFVEYTLEELADFTARMLEAAAEAERGGELKAGTWCTFCPAAAAFTKDQAGREVQLCPALRDEITRQAQVDFDDDPEPIEVPEDFHKALRWVPVIDAWCREMEAVAQRALESGLTVPGKKLVMKKAPSRQWVEKDEKKLVARVVRIAKKLGLPVTAKDVYTDPKLKSPNQVEGLGKGMKKAIKAAGLWFMPEAQGTTMADEDDPRDAVSPSCVTDFEDSDNGQDEDELL